MDKVLKKFYASMKSKFLRDRMALSSINVFKILLTLKTQAIKAFKDCQSALFLNEANLKKIEIKDFQPYEEIIAIFASNLKILYENNTVVVNEQKLDKTIGESYMYYLSTVQTYEYIDDYSPIKLITDYFKAVSNRISQELNSDFQQEKWIPTELEYSVSEVLAYILNGKYFRQTTENILNESSAQSPSEIKTGGRRTASSHLQK